jgi:hypothetical protein
MKMPYHNPCTECLIKSACTEMCDSKNEYTEECIAKLIEYSQHVYEKNGYKRKNVPHHYLRWVERASEICDKNSEECNKILERYARMRVGNI